MVRLRRSLQTAYDWGKRDFKRLVEAMDEADGELGATMGMLRKTVVQRELRPEGEEERNLLDFVDEESVHGMRDAMKKSIEQLQVCDSVSTWEGYRHLTDLSRVTNNPLTAISSASTPISAV